MLRYLSLLALATVLLTSPAAADLLAEAAIRSASGSFFSPIRPECLGGGSGTTSVDVSCSEAGTFGRGRAQADYGTLKAYAELSSQSSIQFNIDYQTFGRARFSDTLTLSSPFLTPGIGTFVTFVFDVTGSVVNNGPGFSEPGDLFATFPLIVKANGVTIEPGFGGGTLMPYSITMFPGSPLALSVELVADVRCFGCDVPYEGVVDFFNTATLMVVEVGVLDPSDFTITSGDGESYANIVPEPGANLSLLVAIGAIAFVKRARR